MLYLSVDFGTSSVKISVADDNCVTLQSAKREYPYIMLPGEKAELDPKALMSAFYEAAQELDPELRSKVEFLCYDTFSPSLVLMDEQGDPLYNIVTHLDRRSRAQSTYIDNNIGRDEFLSITGVYPFTGGVSATTLLWFSQNSPELLNKTHRLGHLPTFIHKQLTGEWAVDLVNASMIGLYKTTTQGGWAYELIKELGFKREWFSDIVNPGETLGNLLPHMAEQLGVPAGIPVSMGTNDAASAHLGAGNSTAGRIMNTAGSSEMVTILTDKPVTNPKYYLRNAALPGLWQIYATTAGGFAVDWFYAQFCREMPKEQFYGEYFRSCLDLTKGNPVTFMPYLAGDRQSLRKKRGAWNGLTLTSTREQMLAALLQSMQGVLYTAIKSAEKILPLDKVIKVAGGLTTPEYIDLKSRVMKGYSFEIVDDCPIKGNIKLAQRYMSK
ncbi:MAG: FGGY-family carbohydrate kinase [Christensenellales bacterium]|jgi:xylulokinase